MNCRVVILVLAAFFASQGVVAPAVAAIPEGPRLAILASNGESSGVITVGPAGEGREVLLEDPDYWGIGEHLSWSADGSLMAFAASGSFPDPPSRDFGTGWPVVAIARSDGSGSRAFPRVFLNGGEPIMAPDGRTVVFSRLKLVKTLPERESYLFKTALWSLDLERGSVKRLTRWRLAAFIDPISFSPDGSSIIVELFDRRGLRIVAIDTDSRRSRRLTSLPDDAREPTYSPDGTKLAYVREKIRRFNLPKPDRPVSELWVAHADGGGAQRVLRAKGYVSFPSWDPSGNRLAFTRNPPAEATGALEPESGNKVMAMNADGTCLTLVLTNPELTLYGSAWQPGVGREAGPILC